MEAEVAALKNDVKSYEEQLETVLSSLQNDAGNSELLMLKGQIEEGIAEIQSAIAELELVAQGSQPKPPEPPVEEPKWSKEKHPAFQPGFKRPGAPPSAPEEAPEPVTYSVNDNIQAKYSDNKFYPARITSKTGSSADPVYTVIFKGYGNTETVRGSDIKPLHNDKKRKADMPPSAASTTPAAPDTPTAPGVISAAANIDPALATQARKEPSKVSDGPARPSKAPRKITATKQLEAGKSKWQEFSAKGKFGKAAKKDSMFRTGESPTARVGVTGSGSAMRKDAARTRHIYDKQADQGE